MFKKIATAGIFVKDMDRSLDFFVNTLGFEVQMDATMGDDRWLEVKPVGAETALSIYREQNPDEHPVGGFTRVIFHVENIKDTIAKMKADGVQFAQDYTEQPWGSYAMFLDPDGHHFMMMEHR